MTDTAPEFSIVNLTSAERDLLDLIPDEEQRSVLYRELLRKHDIPADYTDLSVAENVLIYKNLCKYVFNDLERPLPLMYTEYFTPYGNDDLQNQMADRLNNSFRVNTVKHENVFATAGVSSALQSIALGLQLPLHDEDPPVLTGSQVLLPAPFWQGFHWSFEQTPKLHCVPVNLMTKGAENFQLTLEDLKRTYATTPNPKLLVLTNPHNPLGVNYDESLLESIYEWVLQKTKMHIISDEIYCHSQLTGAKPEFVSALKLEATQSAPDRVHVVWGFAKDFGLSGFRTGFVISKSKYVHSAMIGSNNLLERRRSLSWFTPFDSLKHFYILNLTAKPPPGKKDPWEEVIKQYPSDLTTSFNAVAAVLKKHNIKFVHPDGANSAQFFWLDLREFLQPCHPRDSMSINLFDSREHDEDPDRRKEACLADDILNEAKVKLLTGTALTCNVSGYFRLCFTAHDQQTVVTAVDRMCKYLNSRRTPDSTLR